MLYPIELGVQIFSRVLWQQKGFGRSMNGVPRSSKQIFHFWSADFQQALQNSNRLTIACRAHSELDHYKTALPMQGNWKALAVNSFINLSDARPAIFAEAARSGPPVEKGIALVRSRMFPRPRPAVLPPEPLGPSPLWKAELVLRDLSVFGQAMLFEL